MPKPTRSHPFAQATLFATLALLAAPAFAQSLSLLDARVVEGNAGTSMLLFEARLSAPASGPVSFDFTTSDGSATAGSDYSQLPLVGLLSIPAGQTSLMISVPVTGDTAIEASEYINATLSNVAGATVADGAAQGLIVNDDHMNLISAPLYPAWQQSGSLGYAGGDQEPPAMSRDGRFVAFSSDGRDLVPGRPDNTVRNVYVRDTRTGVTTLATIAVNGGDSDGDSGWPSFSADGRYLVFQSQASNLVANDGNGGYDIFRRDLLNGTTTLVSVERTGAQSGSGYSTQAVISADGRYVAFQSGAADLVAVDTNNKNDVFVRDMQAGTTRLASFGPGGWDSAPEGAWDAGVSADGRYVVYSKGANEVWRRDMQTGAETRASVGNGGAIANSMSYARGISADGRYVLFTSWATNLGVESVRAYPQIWVRDMDGGTTEMVSVAEEASYSVASGVLFGSISADGRYVAFHSLTPATVEDTDGYRDMYVRDLQANTTVRVTQPWTGPGSANASSWAAALSGDGRFVAFMSESADLLPGDGNARRDVFRAELPQDPALPSLSMQDMWVTETDTNNYYLQYTVSLSAPATYPVTFDFATADGTAVAGSDYQAFSQTRQISVGQSSATFGIIVNGDLVSEADEAFNVYLGNVRDARLVDGHAIVVIGDNDPRVLPTLSIGDVSIIEGENGQQTTFTVSLSAASGNTVSFDFATADGSASAGTDYSSAAQTGLSIPAGSTSKAFTVFVYGDRVVESDETFLVNLSNVSNATMADGQAFATIVNDDAYPTLSIDDASIMEGTGGTQQLSFTLRLSATAASPVSVDITTADGTALASSDYTGHSGTGFVIPTGSAWGTFTVAIAADSTVEPNETFLVNLSNVVGATVADGQAVGTIVNDDVLSLSIGDVSISEGNSGTKLATFTVQLSQPATSPVSFSIATANGTAVAGSDYTAKSLSGQTIPAGASSASFTVSINGDLTIEPNETFQVNVSNVTGATVADSSAVGTISNDDALPAVSIADVSIAEGSNGFAPATFTVSLSSASATPVTFNIATANGTAVAPGDYTAMSQTGQMIPAGTLSKTFTVSIKGDKQAESNETFFVNLTNATNATVADGQALGTIVNDDGAAKLSVSRVTTGGLYDDVDDRRGDPVLSSREYALLLLDSAQQVCARAGGATIVGVDGVESLAVLADLADTANRVCARQPQYSAALKANGLGFLLDGVASNTKAQGTQVLELAAPGANARATSVTVLAEGHARPLTVLLGTTPSTIARERFAQTGELNRLVRARLSADPHARLVVLGAAGLDGLVDLTAHYLSAGVDSAERIWVSQAVLEEFEDVRLELPGAPQAKPAQQVLQLLP